MNISLVKINNAFGMALTNETFITIMAFFLFFFFLVYIFFIENNSISH